MKFSIIHPSARPDKWRAVYEDWISRYPDLIYYERNQELVFSGGSYEIRAEGIDK